MTIDNPDESPLQGPESAGSDRITLALTILLTVLIFVGAVTIVLIVRQRSQQVALLEPVPTATVKAAAVVTAQPAATRPPASPTLPATTATMAQIAQPSITATKPAATATSGTVLAPGGATATQAAKSPTAAPASATVAPVATATTARATATVPSAPVATAVIGSASPVSGQPSWYFADGSTIAPYHTVYAIYNPGSQPAGVSITLYPTGGKSVQKTVSAPARSQVKVGVSDIAPSTTFGAAITSNQAVYVERLTTAARDGTATSGVKAARTFYFPEVETGDDFATTIAVFNPGGAPATLNLTYFPVGTKPVMKTYTVQGSSRLAISAQKDVQFGIMSALLESNQPVVAESVIWFDGGESAYGGEGIATVGKLWFVASGNTQPGFTSRVAIFNPNAGEATVRVTLYGSKQQPVTDIYGIAGKSKDDIVLNDRADEQLVAAVLESDLPIAAQTVTYYLSGGETGPLAAYSARAIAAPANQWYLPDVPASSEFDSYLMLFNPGSSPATATVTYALASGEPLTKQYTINAKMLLTQRVLDVVGDKAGVAASVSSTQAIVAERTTMFRQSVGAVASAGIPGQ